MSSLGVGLFIIGIFMAILLGFVSTWKAHHKKIKLSPKRFSKFIWLIGICSVVGGIGLTISFTIDSLPEFSIIRLSLIGLILVVFFPALMVGGYIFDVRYYGYLETNIEKKLKGK
jgi:hypothetical protein